MPSGNGLSCFDFLTFWLNFTRIERCAIPSRATLLVWRGEGENGAVGNVHRHHIPARDSVSLSPQKRGEGQGEGFTASNLRHLLLSKNVYSRRPSPVQFIPSPLIPMTRSRPLARPSRAFASGKFLSPLPKWLKSHPMGEG